MKLMIRCLAALLAVILTAAALFWFWCRVIKHRSFMAGFTDLFLTVQRRSDKFTYADIAEEYIEERREENGKPFEISKPRFGISVREERKGALQAFIYNDQGHPSRTVFYFHGGAYVNQPNAQQMTMAARTAKETGCEVVLVVYPKEPVYTCKEAVDICMEFFNGYVRDNDCGKIVFMGDSAGGGLALALTQQLGIDGRTMPEDLILISPWVDLTMSNRDMQDYVKLDPMLGIEGLRRMGEVWAGDLPMTDHRVSPIYGDLSLDARVLLITGTWEVLYPDTMLLFGKMKDAGTEVDLIQGDRMIHCYPICPIPEAKDALKVIWEVITR